MANYNPTLALISIILAILGVIYVVVKLSNYVSAICHENSKIFDTSDYATFLGLIIILTIFLKSIASDSYSLIWPQMNQLAFRINEREIEYFLRGIRETYYHHLRETSVKRLPKVRTNIMFPIKQKWKKIPILQISIADYFHEYTETELEEKWYQNQGKCGIAWEQKKQHIYAADIKSEDTQFQRMGEKSKQTCQLQSVISTPVLWNDKCIAVLNMDSYHSGKDTLVHTEGVKTIFREGSLEIAALIGVL